MFVKFTVILAIYVTVGYCTTNTTNTTLASTTITTTSVSSKSNDVVITTTITATSTKLTRKGDRRKPADRKKTPTILASTPKVDVRTEKMYSFEVTRNPNGDLVKGLDRCRLFAADREFPYCACREGRTFFSELIEYDILGCNDETILYFSSNLFTLSKFESVAFVDIVNSGSMSRFVLPNNGSIYTHSSDPINKKTCSSLTINQVRLSGWFNYEVLVYHHFTVAESNNNYVIKLSENVPMKLYSGSLVMIQLLCDKSMRTIFLKFKGTKTYSGVDLPPSFLRKRRPHLDHKFPPYRKKDERKSDRRKSDDDQNTSIVIGGVVSGVGVALIIIAIIVVFFVQRHYRILKDSTSQEGRVRSGSAPPDYFTVLGTDPPNYQLPLGNRVSCGSVSNICAPNVPPRAKDPLPPTPQAESSYLSADEIKTIDTQESGEESYASIYTQLQGDDYVSRENKYEGLPLSEQNNVA